MALFVSVTLEGYLEAWFKDDSDGLSLPDLAPTPASQEGFSDYFIFLAAIEQKQK